MRYAWNLPAIAVLVVGHGGDAAPVGDAATGLAHNLTIPVRGGGFHAEPAGSGVTARRGGVGTTPIGNIVRVGLGNDGRSNGFGIVEEFNLLLLGFRLLRFGLLHHIIGIGNIGNRLRHNRSSRSRCCRLLRLFLNFRLLFNNSWLLHGTAPAAAGASVVAHARGILARTTAAIVLEKPHGAGGLALTVNGAPVTFDGRYCGTGRGSRCVGSGWSSRSSRISRGSRLGLLLGLGLGLGLLSLTILLTTTNDRNIAGISVDDGIADASLGRLALAAQAFGRNVLVESVQGLDLNAV